MQPSKVLPRKISKPLNIGKYHKPLPPYLEDLKAKYLDENVTKIDDEDVIYLLDCYARDFDVDYVSFAEVLNISLLSVHSLLRNKKFKEYKEYSDKARAESAKDLGMTMVNNLVNAIDQNKDVNPMMIKAVKVASNYHLAYAQAKDPEERKQGLKIGNGNQINIVTGIPKLNET